MKLPLSYFQQEDVLFLARDLIGKYLFTMKDGQLTGGMIIETEAYKGITDRASHAFGGRYTPRTRTMYMKGGVVYVYLCYGIHHLFNIVTGKEGTPDAILIRAIEPTHGEELMLKRTGKRQASPEMTIGPGKVSKALGITTKDDAWSLDSPEIWIEDRDMMIPESEIIETPRIGVDYAGEDARLPYRFVRRAKER